MTAKPKREGPLRVPFSFDEAVSRALRVKPPEGGWKNYERARARAKRRGSKPATSDQSVTAGEHDEGPEE